MSKPADAPVLTAEAQRKGRRCRLPGWAAAFGGGRGVRSTKREAERARLRRNFSRSLCGPGEFPRPSFAPYFLLFAPCNLLIQQLIRAVPNGNRSGIQKRK